jgi:hypothetical protein
MAEITATGFAPKYLNAYVVAQLKEFDILSGYEQMVPIFPTAPTNIEDVFKNYVGAPGVNDPVLIQYEKLARFRPNQFYRNKREQVVYYIYSTSLDRVMNTVRVIYEALDREDAAAQDVNAWLSDNKADFNNNLNVFFHNLRVYQTDETRDIMTPVSNRTMYVNKMIIEYDYHTTSTFYT